LDRFAAPAPNSRADLVSMFPVSIRSLSGLQKLPSTPAFDRLGKSGSREPRRVHQNKVSSMLLF
jgi:hypothetical protein